MMAETAGERLARLEGSARGAQVLGGPMRLLPVFTRRCTDYQEQDMTRMRPPLRA